MKKKYSKKDIVKINNAELYENYIQVYDKYFYVCFGKNNFDKLSEKYEFNSDWDSFQGMMFVSEDDNKILVLKDSKKIKNYIISHEALHLVFQIFNEVGIAFDFENQEPATYLLDSIIRMIGRNINNEKLNK